MTLFEILLDIRKRFQKEEERIVNQTWSMRDDPANYDDEGKYIGNLDPKTACKDSKRIEEAREAAEEERREQ